MDFSRALRELWAGEQIYRTGWNGANIWLRLQSPVPGSKMTLPYIYMRTAQGDLVPWIASQTDLLSDDWKVL